MSSIQPQMPLLKIYKKKNIGGNGGDVYKPDKNIDFSPNLQLKQIKIGAGDALDSVQFVFSDGMQNIELSKIGGNGGNKFEWNVPMNQMVSEIRLWVGDMVNGIQFFTQNGEKSQVYGREAGQLEKVMINGKLLSYGGRCGACVDQITFYYWS